MLYLSIRSLFNVHIIVFESDHIEIWVVQSLTRFSLFQFPNVSDLGRPACSQVCPDCWPPLSQQSVPLQVQDLSPAILPLPWLPQSVAVFAAPAHLNLVHRPAQTSQMIAKTSPSLIKVLRVTKGSLNWSWYMTFLRVHSLRLCMGASCWTPLSNVAPPVLPVVALLLHSKSSTEECLFLKPGGRKRHFCLYTCPESASQILFSLRIDILWSVLERNCAVLSKERHP